MLDSPWIRRLRARRRVRRLVALGMRIHPTVSLPLSTWVDDAHCYLIEIGEKCSFGEQCLILAHDAQMDEFLDAGRLGTVKIRAWCAIGARVTIMAGTEIGPRTVVLPGSVVLRTLPPDTVCSGNPARPLASLEDYLATHRSALEGAMLERSHYEREIKTAEGRARIAATMASTGVYLPSDRSAPGVPTSAAAPR